MTTSPQCPAAGTASAGVATDNPSNTVDTESLRSMSHGHSGGGAPNSLAQIDQKNRDLLLAAERGDADAVRRLISRCDSKANNSAALAKAAQNGHRDIVRMLIPVSDPKANDSAALSQAAIGGHLQVVRDLIPVSDPQANKSAALRLAAKFGRHNVVATLVLVSDVTSVFQNQLTLARLVKYELSEVYIASINALATYVTDVELDQAVAQLPPHDIDRMPNLAAWRVAQGLRACLRQASSPVPPPPRRRLSL